MKLARKARLFHDSSSAGRAIVESILLVFDVVDALIGLDDIEGEAAMVFHAGGAEDGAEGAGGAALFPDDLTDVRGRDLKPENGDVLVHNGFDADCIRVVDQGLSDFADECANLGDRVGILKRICHYSTSKARIAVFIADFLYEKALATRTNYNQAARRSVRHTGPVLRECALPKKSGS